MTNLVKKIPWSHALFNAALGGFGAWCLTILLSVTINALAPAHFPLWSTTILALLFVTYWYVSWFGEDRVENILKRAHKIAAFAEDPKFEVGDPRRNLTRQFYSLRDAKGWLNEQQERGATNFSLADVRTQNESNTIIVPRAPYRATRLWLTFAYVGLVVILAIVVQFFIETAFPDRKLQASDAQREVYRRFPLWASMILTWVLLAHAEFRKGI